MGANITTFNNYKVTYDYHTHTVYSHGKGTIEDNVKAAIALGLKGIGISDHGPGHLTYGVKRKNLPVMYNEIRALREKYPQIEIFMSVEANFVTTGSGVDVTDEDKSYLDYLIAGYHYGVTNGYCIRNFMTNKFGIGKGDSHQKSNNTKMVIDALYNNKVKILTHPGDKAEFDLDEIAKACAATGTLMEINTWHDHLTLEELKVVKKYDVNFAVSSDAHSPQRVGEVADAIRKAFEAGIEPERIANIEKLY